MTSNVLFLTRINSTSSLFRSCSSVPLISTLPKEHMLNTLVVIRFLKNGKAMEREPEILESPRKGASLTDGKDREPVTWGLVLIVPSLNVFLHADAEMKGEFLYTPPKPQIKGLYSRNSSCNLPGSDFNGEIWLLARFKH